MRLEAVIALVPGVAAPELADWVARGWVLPQGEQPNWTFNEIDVARVRLIRDLRHAMGVEEETLPLVLSLLDQIYDLRRRLAAVLAAMEGQPAPVREAIRLALWGPTARED
jgi:chaperone modulatory protein CbpM